MVNVIKGLQNFLNSIFFFKFDILKSILFKLLARSFEYILINFIFLKNKMDFFYFYILKYHSLKIYKKFTLNFLCKHLSHTY